MKLDEIIENYGPIGAPEVWRSWSSNMEKQNRYVKPELQKWPIPERDQILDAAIARDVVADFLIWIATHHSLVLQPLESEKKCSPSNAVT